MCCLPVERDCKRLGDLYNEFVRMYITKGGRQSHIESR